MKLRTLLRTPRTVALASAALVLASFAAYAADPVPAGVLFESDVAYATVGPERLAVDIARPEGPGPFPAIVCIHGGGFRAGKREGYDKLIQKLAQHGYAAITVTYRLAPAYPFPAAVYDCKAAVRWLRANADKYHVDPARIGVTGGSAGGHLAQFLGNTNGVKDFEGAEGNLDRSSSVACVVNFYGPSDFTKSYGKSVDAAEVLPLFLGGNLETALPAHIRSSPLNWVTPDAVPTLIVHGTEDKYVNYEQAGWMIDRLKSCGVEAELLTMQGAGHGFKGADEEKAEDALIAFFDKHLKPAAAK
jgi:acetyl esterase/lipase